MIIVDVKNVCERNRVRVSKKERKRHSEREIVYGVKNDRKKEVARVIEHVRLCVFLRERRGRLHRFQSTRECLSAFV